MNSCHIGDAGQSVLNDALVLVRKMRLATQLLDIITISLRRRHPPRRSMRLLQKSRIGQIRHHVADRSRTQPFAAGARQRARPHRLSAGNKSLDDRGQDFAFPSARWSWWHISLLNPRASSIRERSWSAPLNSLDAVA